MTDWDYDGPPAPAPEGCGCLAVGPLAILILIGCAALHRFDQPQMLPLIHADYQRCIMVENGPIAPPDDGDDEKTENQPASPPPGADVTDYQQCVTVHPGPLVHQKHINGRNDGHPEIV